MRKGELDSGRCGDDQKGEEVQERKLEMSAGGRGTWARRDKGTMQDTTASQGGSCNAREGETPLASALWSLVRPHGIDRRQSSRGKFVGSAPRCSGLTRWCWGAACAVGRLLLIAACHVLIKLRGQGKHKTWLHLLHWCHPWCHGASRGTRVHRLGNATAPYVRQSR